MALPDIAHLAAQCVRCLVVCLTFYFCLAPGRLGRVFSGEARLLPLFRDFRFAPTS